MAPDITRGSPASLTIAAVSDAPPRRATLRGVITDWGGVFTNSIADAVSGWLDADLIDRDTYRAAMKAWLTQAYDGAGDDNPVHRLERGDGDPAEFERALAARLVRTDGTQVAAEGLLGRMFAGTLPVPAMYDLMRTVRAAGYRTCLLSNSWGDDGYYPREVFPELFDAWVISHEVRMRKPEERIFRHAAALVGLRPEQCVFIDDIEANVAAAAALGMVGVHHTDPAVTATAIAHLLGLPGD
jgi:putative hydrolase of the HAD superfamily